MPSYITILRRRHGGTLVCTDCGVADGQDAIVCNTPGKDWPFTLLQYVKAQMHAHHIISKKDRPDLEFDISNLIPLCHTCHAKRHTITPTWEWWETVY